MLHTLDCFHIQYDTTRDLCTCGVTHAEDLKFRALQAGSPTHGELAAELWGWSNARTTPYSMAAETMRAAGYKPFMGYPLVRG